MMKHRAIFFSNVTLGYGSPKYILQLQDMVSSGSFKSVISIEPYEKIRKKIPIDVKSVDRIICGDLVHKFTFLNGRLDSFFLQNRVAEPLSKLVQALFLIWFAILSYFRSYFIVTTYPSFIFGLFSKRTVFLQNFSEIWNDDEEKRSYSTFKGRLLGKYRKSVSFCIAPQKDRLEMARKIYVNSEMILAENCPPRVGGVPDDIEFDKKIVLYQGRVSPLANADEIIDFAENLDPDVEFNIAGIVNDDYRAEIERLHDQGKIVFHGYLNAEDLKSLRNKCNIGLVSWSNNSLNTKYCAPNKLYEYIACGMYVVAFENYSMRDLYDSYEYGYIEGNGGKSLAKFVNELGEAEMKEKRRHNLNLHRATLNHEVQEVRFREIVDGFGRERAQPGLHNSRD